LEKKEDKKEDKKEEKKEDEKIEKREEKNNRENASEVRFTLENDGTVPKKLEFQAEHSQENQEPSDTPPEIQLPSISKKKDKL